MIRNSVLLLIMFLLVTGEAISKSSNEEGDMIRWITGDDLIETYIEIPLHRVGPTTKTNFKVKEFECSCGRKHPNYISLKLVRELQLLRSSVQDAAKDLKDIIGEIDPALIITSGYRCTDHNKDEYGTESSWHLVGHAADVLCPKNMPFAVFLYLAKQLGFNQIIPYEEENFIHLVKH